MTTVLAYFNIAVLVILVLFLLSGSNKKEQSDYVIMTCLLFLSALFGAIVSMSYLGVF